jgi:hypothetical protein
MTNQRTYMLVALVLLLSPIGTLASYLTPKSTIPIVSSTEATQTYTSSSITTYYGSTTQMTNVQVASSFSPSGIGFLAPKGRCAEYTLPVTVTSGMTLNVAMTANSPVSFYLFPTYAFQTSPNGCSIIGSAILTVNNFTKYLLHWTPQSSGTFYFLFTASNAILILMDHGSTKPVQELANITYATSTETRIALSSSTSTLSYTTTEVAASPLYLPGSAGYAAAIISVIALLAITLLFVQKRHHSGSHSSRLSQRHEFRDCNT